MGREKMFSESELEAIAKALADTSEGLTGSEIGHILASLKIDDPDPSFTKWKRLYNAFIKRQNHDQARRAILAFIRRAMRPERYVRQSEKFEILRTNLNQVLAFSGLAVDSSGSLDAVDRVQTISQAEQRAKGLRENLSLRRVHPDVLIFCKAELLSDNYFHAVLEATKSIANKLRAKTGLTNDGADLIDVSLSGNSPRLAINARTTESQRSEQSGFANLLKGVFGMFRNPMAHEAKILWDMPKEDAEDLLSMVSLIHRRLDMAKQMMQ